LWVRDPVDVALCVYGLAVLISREIDFQIYWLAAKYAGYFWERVTTHERVLWTVASRLGPKAESRLINIAHGDFAAYNPAMPRELVWIDQPRKRGWGCSQCEWIFSPTDPPIGESIDAMMRNFESQREKEFASHVCSNHPRRPKHTPDAT